MKAEIVNGTLILEADNATEQYAIDCWYRDNYVALPDPRRNTQGHYIDRAVKIKREHIYNA